MIKYTIKWTQTYDLWQDNISDVSDAQRVLAKIMKL